MDPERGRGDGSGRTATMQHTKGIRDRVSSHSALDVWCVLRVGVPFCFCVFLFQKKLIIFFFFWIFFAPPFHQFFSLSAVVGAPLDRAEGGMEEMQWELGDGTKSYAATH